MKSDQQISQLVRAALDDCTRGLEVAPSLQRQIAQKAKGEEPVAKKLSTGMIIVLAIMAISAVALATTLLWQDAGEQIAPLEGANGYYDTWNTEAKVALVKALYDLGELKGNSDAERLLKNPGTAEEQDGLCDQIMTAYVAGTPDTVTLLSILERLHGDISTWPMEDLVWYNDLLRRNGLLTAEDMHYVLPEAGELDQAQAVALARGFLASKGAQGLEQATVAATLTEETEDAFYGEQPVSIKGRRVWSIVFRPQLADLPYGGAYNVTLQTDGTIISYDMPQLVPLMITGTLPNDTAIPQEQAISLAKTALAKHLNVSESDLNDLPAFFGYITLADAQLTHAKLGQQVWAVTAQGAYALLSPSGDVLYTGNIN